MSDSGALIQYGKLGTFLQDFAASEKVQKAAKRGVSDKPLMLETKRMEVEIGILYLKAAAELVKSGRDGCELSKEEMQSLFVSASIVSQATQAQAIALIFDAVSLRENTKVGGKPAKRRTPLSELMDAMLIGLEEISNKEGASMSLLYDIGKFIDSKTGGKGEIYAIYDKHGVQVTPDKYTNPPPETKYDKPDEAGSGEAAADAVLDEESEVVAPTPEDIRKNIRRGRKDRE